MAKVKEFKYKFVDDSGKVIEESTSKLGVLEEAVKKTSEALKNADVGSEKWKNLQDSLKENEKALTKAQVKTEGVGATLQKLPGPIGQVAQGFGSLSKVTDILGASWKATGIGLIAGIFTTLYNALKKTDAGMDALNKITAVFSATLRPLMAAIENIATYLAEKLAGALEFVGSLFGSNASEAAKYSKTLDDLGEKEAKMAVERANQNKELAAAKDILTDTNATYEERKKALDKVRTSEEALAKREMDLAREKADAIEKENKLLADSEENRKRLYDAQIALANAEESYFAKQRQFNKEDKKLKAEDDAAQKERAKAAEERRKEDLANRKAAAEKIRTLDQENQLLAEENERKRDLKAQEFAKAAQLREIEAMKLTKAEKSKLLEEVAEQDRLKIQTINKKYDEEEKKAADEKAAKEKKEKEDKDKEDLAAREKTRTERLQDFDTLIADEEKTYEERKAIIAEAEQVIKNDTDLTERERTQALAKYAEARKKIEEAELEQKYATIQAGLQIAAGAGKALQDLAGKNKKLAKAGILVEQGAAIGSIIVNSQKNAAKAGYATPQGIFEIVGGIVGVATAVAAASKAIKEIDKVDTEAGGGGETKKIATSYAQGGLLTGKRHGAGGITTPMGELEGGEYVVNRASTASFLPLLESINSMGTGTGTGSGNVSSGIENAGLYSAPPIIKTYVVASDVSSQQEADKMISDLARL